MNSLESFIKTKFIPPEGETFLDYGPPLPAGYKGNFLYLLIKDPECVFAYWEVADNTKGNKPILIIYDITNQKREEVSINGFIGNWYIQAKPDTIYEAEIGYFEGDVFKSVYKSNRIKTPRKRPSGVIDEEWQLTPEELEMLKKLSYQTISIKYARLSS